MSWAFWLDTGMALGDALGRGAGLLARDSVRSPVTEL